MQQRQEKKQKQTIQDSRSKEAESQKAAMYALTEEDRTEIGLIVSLYKKVTKFLCYDIFNFYVNMNTVNV